MPMSQQPVCWNTRFWEATHNCSVTAITSHTASLNRRKHAAWAWRENRHLQLLYDHNSQWRHMRLQCHSLRTRTHANTYQLVFKHVHSSHKCVLEWSRLVASRSRGRHCIPNYWWVRSTSIDISSFNVGDDRPFKWMKNVDQADFKNTYTRTYCCKHWPLLQAYLNSSVPFHTLQVAHRKVFSFWRCHNDHPK